MTSLALCDSSREAGGGLHEADFVFKSHTLWPEEGSVGDLILTSNEV